MDALYTRDLLRHAALAHGAGRLEHPGGSASLANPLCGDRVVIDVVMDQDRIGRIGHQVRACVLCQASASILSLAAPGRTGRDIRIAADHMTAALAGGAFEFDELWADLRVFAPAAPIKGRHSCVLMPFNGLIQAISNSLDTTYPLAGG